MLECPTKCPFSEKIALLEQQDKVITDIMARIEKKIDDLSESVSTIKLLEKDYAHNKEGLDRAHHRIDDLLVTVSLLTQYKDKADGMARMAWLLWTGLGAAVVSLLVKVFGLV